MLADVLTALMAQANLQPPGQFGYVLSLLAAQGSRLVAIARDLCELHGCAHLSSEIARPLLAISPSGLAV
jgi:hypothetical protein